MLLDRRAQASERPRADHAVGVEKQQERLGGEFRTQVAAGSESAILRRADHLQPRMRLECCDHGLEGVWSGGIVDEHDLAGLTERRVEAGGQQSTGIVIDDYDCDRREWTGRDGQRCRRLVRLVSSIRQMADAGARLSACTRCRLCQHF